MERLSIILIILGLSFFACSSAEAAKEETAGLEQGDVRSVIASGEAVILNIPGKPAGDRDAAAEKGNGLGSFEKSNDSGESQSYAQSVQDIAEKYNKKVEGTHAFYQDQIEAIWNEYRESTKRIWVEYSDDVSAMNEVNFMDGVVRLETAIPVTDDDSKAIEEKIVERLLNSLSDDNLAGVNPLENQLAFPKTGETVNRDNARRYFEEEIKGNLQRERLDSRDGIPRYRYSVKLQMIPDHMQVRVRKFLPEVIEYSKTYDLSPALVLAVIHTESWFNPLAVSKAGACGLMQLVPTTGGMDSYKFVSGKSSAPSREFLFVPRNNIQLGTAYIYLLQKEQLQYKGRNEKGKILTLCAYNWGPGSVNKNIIRPNRIENLSIGELKRIIKQKAPEETANYFAKILEREKIYERMFD